MKVIIPLFLVLFTAVGCKKGGLFCYSSDGTSVSEMRSHDNFTDIHLCIDATVYINQSNDYSVEVVAAENLLPIIETKQKGDNLEIDLKRGKCLKDDSNIQIYIGLPQLEELNISGSGSVYLDHYFSTEKLKIDVSGSGEIYIDSLSTQSLDINISGSGEIELMTMDTMENQDINISGSGSINAFSAATEHADIRISGSGGCDIHATKSLNANISGSGDLRYMGNPNVSQNISGSGSVRPY